MSRHPKGYRVDAHHLKLAVSFEEDVFHRLVAESEDRGASVSEHVNWLLKRGWRLEQELTGIKGEELQHLQELQRFERRTLLKLRRAEGERRNG